MLYLRNLAFYSAAIIFSGPFLLLSPLAYLPIPTRIVWPFVITYLRGILFLLKWLAGLRYEIHNAERLGTGAVLFAPAHQSTWENLFFHVLLGNPAMIAKEEILGYPLAGNIARRNRHIPAYRDGEPEKVRESFAEVRRQAKEGRSILIYPSGTRTGTRLSPAIRRGVAALYGMLDRPCVPVAHNSGLFWPNDSWLRKPGTIIVEIGEPIQPGLEKEEFLKVLKMRLYGATDRLLQAGAREYPNLAGKPGATG